MSSYREELADRLLKFSVSIIRLASLLPKNSAGFAIANQIIRSACSIGANVQEAQDSISRKEFLHSINFRGLKVLGIVLSSLEARRKLP